MEQEKRKSNVQHIIDTLLNGEKLGSREIAERITNNTDRNLKVQDISSLLCRVTDPKKCNLGYFIQKTREGTGFLYSLPEELLQLPKENIYGLAVKTGDDHYPLGQALNENPDLQQFVENANNRLRERGDQSYPGLRGEYAGMSRDSGFGEDEVENMAGAIFRGILSGARDLNINLNIRVSFEGFGANTR